MLQPVFICNYECRVFSLACFPLTDPCPPQEIPGVGGTEIALTQRMSRVELSWVIHSEGLLCHSGVGHEGLQCLNPEGGRKKDVPCRVV